MVERNLYLSRSGTLLYQTHLNELDEVFTQVGACGIHNGVPCNDVTVTLGAAPLDAVEAEAIEEEAVTEPTVTLSFDEMSVEDLKGLLRERDLPVSGTKAELVIRLNGWDEMTAAELREELRDLGLPTSGTKEELLWRLSDEH